MNAVKKKSRIWSVLCVVVLAVLEFGLDLHRASRFTGGAFVLLVALAVLSQVWDIRRAIRADRREQEGLPPEDEDDLGTKVVVGGFSLIDKGFRKLNPDYDPDAERNARRADPEEVRKLDEMKQAGLIDGEEYRRRVRELAER